MTIEKCAIGKRALYSIGKNLMALNISAVLEAVGEAAVKMVSYRTLKRLSGL
jgi:hypothetical protein